MLTPARLSCLLFLFLLTTPLNAAPIDYVTSIQPILNRNCTQCHGTKKQKAGLRLETGLQLLKGSLNGPVVVPKKSGESLLMLVLHGEGDAGVMPPKGPLTDAEIKLIEKWIDEGALVPANEKAETHWSYVAPRQVDLPKGQHPIDALLAIERTGKVKELAPPADRETLLKRATLDLTGLPPTPEEIDAFLKDTSSDAYEKRIDALLASPRYGERWGRHFLDIWRYSDWYGYGAELRYSQKHIWNWRDWTVESLNANKPYDAMIREMLAGDEIAPDDPAVVRATGFLARNYYKFNRNVWLDEIVEHTGKAFLGVTMNCCRCHDHMYDPLTQEEYYRFRAIFEPHQIRLDPVAGETDTEKRGLPRVYDADLKAVTYRFERGDEKRPVKDVPIAPGVPHAIHSTPFAPKESKVSATSAHPTLRDAVRATWLDDARKAVTNAKDEPHKLLAMMNERALQAKLNAENVRYTKPAPELIRHAVALHLEAALMAAEVEAADADAAVKKLEKAEKKDEKAIAAARKKGMDLKAKVDVARKAMDKPPADYPPLMPNYPESTTGRRTALANWIASKENPLTARVLMNHLWLRHYGRPIVPSMFEFGKNGRPPSHPALLDWLAVEFMKSNWDMKRMHKLLMTSNAYKMQSNFANADNQSKDPDNILLWRMNPRALESEAIRDRLLFVSGLLDETRGGPELDVNDESPKQRRSLYYRHAPEKTMPFLMAFDSPSPTECYRRPTSVAPQQAMALVNSKLSYRAAEALSVNAAKETDRFIVATYRKVLGRLPNDAEKQLCSEFLKSNPPVAFVQVLFNHTEFSTIR